MSGYPVAHSEPALQPVADILFLLPVEIADIVFEPVDPCADRERDADGRYDRLAAVKGLDLDLHLREVLLCAAHDDLPVALVAEAHYDEGIDLGKDLRVHVLRLLGHDTEPDAELPPFHRTLAEDLGGGAARGKDPLCFFDGDQDLVG